jgi:protein-S-isoprenylcysteine O-methyltransferase Ste14
MTNEKHSALYRGNLRNLIRILSYISVFFFRVNTAEIAVGFGLLGLGCIVHYITKGELVRNVIMCNNGIYGIVRHPYYMANYLIDVSFCLLSGSPYLLLIYPFLFFWVYGPTLRKEERFLAETHNEPYIEYMLDVPQVFPDSYFAKYLKGIFSGFSKKRISRNEVSRIMRFWATALFILFLHTIKGVKLGAMDYSILYRSCLPSFTLFLVILLYLVSLLVRGKRAVVL